MSNTVSPKSIIHPNAAQIFLLIFLFASFIFAYFPIWKSLINLWSSSDDYSHGFFIIPISLYIIWSKREVLSKIPVTPSIWGGILAVFSLLVYIVSSFAGIATLASLSIVPLACGIVIHLFGLSVFKECMFPLAFLIFMVPVPSQIYSSLTNPLQLIVSKASVWGASLLGIPLFREGNIIHLPDHTLQVVQACSGLRSLMTLLTLSSVFGYLSLKSNILRSLLFVTGIPAAILVNIIRVVLMIIAFYYFNFDLTTGSIHTAFGVIIFIMALAIVATAKGVLSRWDR